jgi:hypothetical protein
MWYSETRENTPSSSFSSVKSNHYFAISIFISTHSVAANQLIPECRSNARPVSAAYIQTKRIERAIQPDFTQVAGFRNFRLAHI